ncbi:MAG TPA: protein kinase [Gemmatimonadaceae bacterium]|nr:protein kinase [Gemmatimonadaceae bacterium]
MATELHDILQSLLGDSYAIERELGGGGMSRVFLAREKSLSRRVVIKVLPPELSSGVSAARFQREILVTANLQHPHILPVLAAGAEEGILYYIMPYVEGQSLRERITFEGPLPVNDALQILREVLSALAQAHARGVVHRDVKPENILLSGGHAILADFGIARAIAAMSHSGDRLTGTGFGVGTLGYMAPEQLAGDPTVDARADVFAVGVVGYEMLTGLQPFTGSTPHALASAYFADTPRPLSEVRPELPQSCGRAIMKSLHSSPDQRFPSAAEFRDALGPAISQDVPAAVPKHKRLVAAAVLTLATIGLISLGVIGWRLKSNVSAGRLHEERIVLAVLPFKNLGPADDAYFADGITEEVTSRLASISELGVISRTSADQYRTSTKTLRQIADELGANYVLEGSVRWERRPDGQGRVRVTPQLIRVRDDSHLWADRIDADLRDVFSVQSEIAERVAEALAIALGANERSRVDARPTESLAAYDTYMRADRLFGHDITNPSSLLRSAQLFGEAAAEDPKFALALAKQSIVNLEIYDRFIDHTEPRLEAARIAADSALKLDRNLPEAHVAQGRLHELQGDYDKASAEYAIAEKAKPNDGLILARSAAVLARRGHWNEAIRRLERAAELDPRSVETNAATAEGLMLMRSFPGAARYGQRAFAADSESIRPHLLQARLHLMQGDLAALRQTAHSIVRRFGAERASTSDGFEVTLVALDTADIKTLAEVPPSAFANQLNYYLWRFMLFERWKPAVAAAYADSVLAAGQPIREMSANDYRVRAVVGHLFALKGDRAQAIRETRRALELMPITRDHMAWAEAAEIAAVTYVQVGEYDAAIELIDQLLRMPSPMTVARLRADPRWAPLRTHPRYAALATQR